MAGLVPSFCLCLRKTLQVQHEYTKYQQLKTTAQGEVDFGWNVPIQNESLSKPVPKARRSTLRIISFPRRQARCLLRED